jgi:integrase
VCRLLDETAARAGEVLASTSASWTWSTAAPRFARKGNAVDVSSGRPRVLGSCSTSARLLLDPATGRARLSYRRAAELFEQATAVCPGGPWTLHQLRHSALTYAAEAGANTATLLAYSGHTSVASLARYARVSPAALAHWQARRDPAARRR